MITVQGININYIQKGQGADILVLHGWGANIGAVMPIVDLLCPHFRVTALDFPGFGQSGNPPANWDIYSYANFTAEFCRALDLRCPILMGHSFGGRVSIILSARKMMDICRIVLIDSAGVKPHHGADYYAKIYSYKAAKNFAKLVGKFSQNAEDKIKSRFGSADYKNADPLMRTIMVRVVNEDLTNLLPDISHETLLIWGEKDDATPLADARLMEKRIPNAGLAVIGGAGHFSYLDNFAQFSAIMKSFLEV